MAPIITANILEGLSRVAPEYRVTFERNRREFLGRLDEAMARWAAVMAPYKGAKVVVYHTQWAYILTRFGLVQVGTVEERPGIPPTPGHLTKLIALMKGDRVKALIVEPWSDVKLAERVAQEAGAKAVVLAAGVGAVKGADTYLDAIDFNVRALAQALQ
jgi:ABC-type Zn uptake system ZnuABC Zn-binding protein ZnuA